MNRSGVLVGLVSILVGAGCSGADRTEDEVETASSELRLSMCTLLETCPNDIPLTAAVAASAPGRKIRRPDITADGALTASNAFQGRMFGPLSVNQDVSMTLSGPGLTDPFLVDDILLFEVIDAHTNDLLAVASVDGYAAGQVKLAGSVVPHLGSSGTLSHDAGSVDLGPILPKGRLFFLRVTAVDTGGAAQLSTIVGHVKPSLVPPPAPPPPPTVDPFDAASCADVALTKNDATSYFAPGTSSVTFPIATQFHVRERTCNAVTGCAPWQVATVAPLKSSEGSFYGMVPADQSGKVVLFVSNGKIYGALGGTTYPRVGYPGYVNTLGAIFGVGFGGSSTLVTTAGNIPTTTGVPVRGTVRRAVITPNCVQVLASLDTQDPTQQMQVAWFGAK